MKMLDRVFGWLLVVGGLMHAAGSWTGYRSQPETLVWGLSGSLAAILLAALNLLRASRPADRQLAWVSFGGSLAWIAVAIGFGSALGNVLDPRVVVHAINAAVLAAMSLRTIANARPNERQHTAP